MVRLPWVGVKGAVLRRGTTRSRENPILETRHFAPVTRLPAMLGQRADPVGTVLATTRSVSVPSEHQYIVLPRTLALASRRSNPAARGATERAGPWRDV